MKYRTKRVEIEAIEFTGGNYGSVDVFMDKKPGTTPLGGPYKIDGKDGVQRAYRGDFIIKQKGKDFIILSKEELKERYEEISNTKKGDQNE